MVMGLMAVADMPAGKNLTPATAYSNKPWGG